MIKHKPHIEIEFRGSLSGAKHKQLTAYGSRNGKFLGAYKQLAIFCDTQGERLGNFYDPKVRIALQLSYEVKTKKRSLHLKVKNGHWANVGRQEVVLHLKPEELPEAYQLLRAIGISSGCPRFYHRVDYQFGDITLSLKDGGLAPDHWEAEISATKRDEKKAHRELLKFLKDLELAPWSETEYKKIINKVYHDNPPVAFEKIDASRALSE